MALKLGRRLRNRRCRYCRTWQVYECGFSHHGLFGRLTCSQCHNTGVLCADPHHPSNRWRSDC
jgi:hypothetical protein